jgi:hypothetical protein
MKYRKVLYWVDHQDNWPLPLSTFEWGWSRGTGGGGVCGVVGIMGQLSPGSAMSRVRFNILDLVNRNSSKSFPKPKVNRGIFLDFMYCIQHCFICRPSDTLRRRMLGSNPGLLRLRHWQSDALTTSLDLIHKLHCIPAEDLLPQRKHIDSWDEDKAYSTPGK